MTLEKIKEHACLAASLIEWDWDKIDETGVPNNLSQIYDTLNDLPKYESLHTKLGPECPLSLLKLVEEELFQLYLLQDLISRYEAVTNITSGI